MAYQVLARKWRPQNFKQMVGQEHVLQALVHALENQRLHHAYLFTGTRGVGKTTIGRILAKCLSCEKGITAEPCGQCFACTGISEGRYVDLIEIDAASRTKVEDMRELLDNVQYSPTEGRFKIYLIDEVHMLSTSSFNALLKTLEEPPEHVKFLFATTDPQKLPVTILSRCLQFNLKNMSAERIVDHLKFVLGQEQVTFEDGALWALARSADGSMRDALSLTDQAIAYGNNALLEVGVAAMLGTVDQKRIYKVLDALVRRDAAAMLNEVAQLAEFSPDYGAVLAELAAILHRIAVEQVVPGAIDNALGDQAQVRHYARDLIAEDVQLFYQIALVGRKDMAITPDQRAGLDMALLRMLAFRMEPPRGDMQPLPGLSATEDETETLPDAESKKKTLNELPERFEPEPEIEPESGFAPEVQDEPEPLSAPVHVSEQMPEEELPPHPVTQWTEQMAEPEVDEEPLALLPDPLENPVFAPRPETERPVVVSETTSEKAPESSDAIWPIQVRQLGLSGMTLNLVMNMAHEIEDGRQTLYVERGHFRLLTPNHEARIREAIAAQISPVPLVFVEGLKPGQETPAMWFARREQERLVEAKRAIFADPQVQSLLEAFDARIIEDSIRPRVPNANEG